MSRASNRAEVHERFKKDTAEHQMTVLRDDGLYRHLRFRKPGTGIYGFDIVTWPGYLAISGDMGASMFTRLEDMIQFSARTRTASCPSTRVTGTRSAWRTMAMRKSSAGTC